MPETLSILVADDHPLFLTGLRQVIENVGHFSVVAEANDGVTALKRLRDLHPAVAVLDLRMPGMSGLAVAREFLSESTNTKIIILTAYDDEEMFNDAMDIGVLGYVLKDSATAEIVRCIDTVAMGEYFVSPALTSAALKTRTRAGDAMDAVHGLDLLTTTERRVLRLVARDHTTADIAEMLTVSPRTVDHHRANICRKLELSGINSLLRFALQHRAHI